jgi:TolA-binding protein
LQPSEQQARQAYQTAIQSAGDSPLALEAMFELAELLAERQQHEQAIALLRQLFDREPPAELVEKVHLRLAACLLASGDAKSALQHAQTVLQNQKSPHVPWARYLAAECYLQLGGKENAQQAVSLLSGFRDHGPWQQLAGLSDRALLRLSAAYAVLGQWGPSRQASEILIQRFPQSPHRSEAQFAIGWAWQNENNLDAAIQAYSQVLGLTYAEPAARAQLQIARCRALQKRWPDAIQAYLLVHLTYDYPELAGQALWEAAEAAQQNKQPEQAQRLLQQLLNEYPQTKAAQLARQRLERKD